MATCFDRWEKDPFFSAAEEVQESADRLESIYRQWMHEMKHSANPSGEAAADGSGELRRELHTALGTAKWQLEELDRAVRSSDEVFSSGKDTRLRHSQFVAAIGNKILMVEDCLKNSNLAGEAAMSWVRLDEEERDELALFLSCPLPEQKKVLVFPSAEDLKGGASTVGMNEELDIGHSRNCCRSNELGPWERKEDSVTGGHRRTASASGDIKAWKISVTDEDGERPNRPPPKIASFSCLTKIAESTSKMNWSRNGFRKWKGGDQQQMEEAIPLRNNELSQGISACYERSKNCLSNCGEDKQLYGWLGALHRQLQRSQYQIQYGRPIQMIFWTILVVLLIVLCALRAI